MYRFPTIASFAGKPIKNVYVMVLAGGFYRKALLTTSEKNN